MLNFLGILSEGGSIFNLDKDILLYIQDNIRCGILDKIFPLITHLGDAGLFWIILSAVLLLFKKTRKAGFISALALIGSVLLNNLLLKPLVNRTRPYELIEALKLIGKAADDGSFPSGHTAASIASAVAMFPNLKKRYGIPLFILALCISFSRLYIGIHYPSDVVAGFVIGLVLGILANILGNLMIRKWQQSHEKAEASQKESDV